MSKGVLFVSKGVLNALHWLQKSATEVPLASQEVSNSVVQGVPLVSYGVDAKSITALREVDTKSVKGYTKASQGDSKMLQGL